MTLHAPDVGDGDAKSKPHKFMDDLPSGKQT